MIMKAPWRQASASRRPSHAAHGEPAQAAPQSEAAPVAGDGSLPTRNDRWVARRKAEVVAAVCGGLLSLEEACRRYALSVEEFQSWQKALDRDGLDGLKVRPRCGHRPRAKRKRPAAAGADGPRIGR